MEADKIICPGYVKPLAQVALRTRLYKITDLGDGYIEIRSRKVPLFERATVPDDNLPELARLRRKKRALFNEKCEAIISLTTGVISMEIIAGVIVLILIYIAIKISD